MIEIDGSLGEGGGQILRTSLALSAITGKPFILRNIRANRKKPGLMPQHITGVSAMAAICKAKVTGGSLHSKYLEFYPGTVRGGNYEFHIGSAGSTGLIMQTILYPLLFAPEKSTVLISGGTHCDMAPPFDFLEKSFVPILQNMGYKLEISLEKFGFYPAGGGCIRLHIEPSSDFKPIHIIERGLWQSEHLIGIVSRLSKSIIEREATQISKNLNRKISTITMQEVESLGPGNAIILINKYENITHIASAFGSKRLSAEEVADNLCNEHRTYMLNDAPIDEHLADQLLIPMSFAMNSKIRITNITPHFETNCQIISLFLPTKFQITKNQDNSSTLIIV